MKNSPEKNKEKEEDKKKGISYKINLYQNETNFNIKLLIVEGKLQIDIKSKKSFTEDIYEFSNTYSLRQLQITNKYFSKIKSIEEVCSELNNLLKLKVIIEEDKEKDKTLIVKIPTSTDKSSGDIIFRLLKTKKVKKVINQPDKLKGINNKNYIYENNLKGKNDDNNGLLLNELVTRIRNLERREVEKEKKINKLKEDMNNYQEKINNNINYPVYSPLANKNNNISQIIKQRNEENDDDDVDMDLETEKRESIKEKKKTKEKNNKLKGKKKRLANSDEESENSSESEKKKKKKKRLSDSSEEISEKEIKNKSNLKEDSDEDKSNNIILKNKNNNININEKPPQLFESLSAGFPFVQRDPELKNYINSRIFFTKGELQMVKKQITKGKKNLHAYFDLLYRATFDQPKEESIISNCEGKYPQITLFYTKQGARFGVYVDKAKTTTFFKKEVIYKEKPGTSFLFSLNSLKTYPIEKGELATDNRPEKLCFGRTYRYNNNESNWLIYIPRNDFLDMDLTFGDKESSFGDIKTTEIIGLVNNYQLKDVEIFKVEIDNENGVGLKDNDDDDNSRINIIEEKDNKKKVRINNNDETISGEKITEDNNKEEDIKISDKKVKNFMKSAISNINNDKDDDSD